MILQNYEQSVKYAFLIVEEISWKDSVIIFIKLRQLLTAIMLGCK